MANHKAIDFDQAFTVLTGNPPLSWQKRLYLDHFAKNELSCVIDLPTGLGKTMIMAIWLIASSVNKALPRRLIYVVDRRTVVDQATDLAEQLVKNWKEQRLFSGDPPAISTLRGQLADNREWSRDPSREAIIIGTVDLIGSALLFSGYRSSFKRRPLEAGLLGQDSLLILDEAHLSKPFEKLLGSISDFQKSHSKPMQFVRMSATSGSSDDSNRPFTLQFDENGHLAGDDAKDATVAKRFGATKTLSIEESENLIDGIVTHADKLATANPGSRIVIFVRKPKQVADLRKALEKKKKDYGTCIARLTGTMRGLERDELVDTEKPLGENDHERRVMQRFLKPKNDASQGTCFLISTSAGEVGFDLNADHMVCDEAPLDSMVQRLGRVNRRGESKATIVQVREKDPADKTDFDKACLATSKLLIDGMDVSPRTLAVFRKSLSPEQIDETSTPKPKTVELTDILLDAWSMTSITEPMPGRPDVGPWLRGNAEWEPPATTIAWRAELDVNGFADLDIDDIEEWFDAHRILTHETLTVNASDAATWFRERWAALSETRKSELASRPVVIDRAGIEIINLREIVERVSGKGTDSDVFLRNAEIIVPASFGGIRRGDGLLNPAEPEKDLDKVKKPRHELQAILDDRQRSIDVADVRGRYRYRVKIEKPENGESVTTALAPNADKPDKTSRYVLELASDDKKTVRLVSYVARTESPETGSKPQTLRQHVCAVRTKLNDILGRISLPDDIMLAAELAAEWHDHGKNRERWQRLLVYPRDFIKPDEPMGKSGGEMKRDPRGYRHEFGSLREFNEAFRPEKLPERSEKPINQDVFDLAMHLIATHHGRGRPHFPKGGFDPDDEASSETIHTESIRRFARLQRKYGWWHLAWLENLLRCADALASADIDTEDQTEDSDGGDA